MFLVGTAVVRGGCSCTWGIAWKAWIIFHRVSYMKTMASTDTRFEMKKFTELKTLGYDRQG